MPNIPHELLVSLFQEAPDLAGILIERSGISVLAEHDTAACKSANFSETVSPEYRADECVLLSHQGQATQAIIIEVQEVPKPRKLLTWPCYSAIARARYGCVADVLVLTLNERTARWARQPIPTGTYSVFQPLVIGPSDIPRITMPEEAIRHPELAVLSAAAHGPRPDGLTIVANTLSILPALDLEDGRLYNDFILSRLPEAARKVLNTMLDRKNYKWQGQYSKSLIAKGQLSLLFKQLTLKFGPLPEGVEAHLESLTEAEREAVAERLLTATTLNEALGH